MRTPFAMILMLTLPAPLAAQVTLQPPSQQDVQISGFTHSFRSTFGVSYADNAAQQVQAGAAGLYTLGFRHRTDSGIGFDFQLQLRAGNVYLPDTPAHGEPGN